MEPRSLHFYQTHPGDSETAVLRLRVERHTDKNHCLFLIEESLATPRSAPGGEHSAHFSCFLHPVFGGIFYNYPTSGLSLLLCPRQLTKGEKQREKQVLENWVYL